MREHSHSDLVPDEDLLRNMADGCAECFPLLFRRYYRQVYSVAYRILRDRSETEDILQEVFVSIYEQQERFNPQRGSVRTWVLQFAYFKALLRRRYLNVRSFYKQEEISESRELRQCSSPEVLGLSPIEWARFVETGITSLNPKQRRVIELVHFEGYTLKESADILRETLASTRNYYYRGLKALRKFLEVQPEEAASRGTSVLERNDAYGFQS